jgi:hypothetical protein
MAAALSVLVVMAAGLLTVRPVPAGAAERRIFEIFVSDAGFNPSAIPDANVGDVLMFTLHETTERHTVTFEESSSCPGDRGAEPCWPELRFDDGNPNCLAGNIRLPGRRCMIVQEPGKTVKYHDAFNTANGGEIKVLGQPTTTTGPSMTTTTRPPTTTTTAPSTTTTQPPTTVTTAPQTTTSTAPTQIRPFVMPDPSSTTSTIPAVTLTNNTGTTAAAGNNGKGNDRDKDTGKSKAAGTDTPTTVSSAPADAMPPDAVFDPAALTPGPALVPDGPGGAGVDDVNLASSAVVNLLDPEESDSLWPLVLAFGALASLVLVLGIWAWLHRASRYYPA